MKEKLKAIKRLNNWMNEKWDYGFILDGKRMTEEVADLDDLDWSAYRTTPVEELSKTKIGCCWDFVNYQHHVFKKYDISDKAYMFVSDLGVDGIQTHTFSIIDIDGKKYWVESAFWKHRGVHEVNNRIDVVEYIKTEGYDWDLYTYLPEGLDQNLSAKTFIDLTTRIKIASYREVENIEL